MRVIYSQVYLFTRITHLLIKNFLVLYSTSIAFNISTDLIMWGNISFLKFDLLA